MKEVADALEAFLKSKSAKVIAIKGPWGSGKTYFWGKIVEKLQPPQGIEHYAYVSLFGASSIEDINNAIIAKTKIWNKGTLEAKVKRIAANPMKGALQVLRNFEIPYVPGSQLLAQYAVEFLIGKHLVCFDDLERKSDSLDSKAFIGLISQLTEQKSCKVVLIYNHQEVRDGTLTKAISAARDKLVDFEVLFDPSVEYNLGIANAANEKTTKEGYLDKYAKKHFLALNNRNIRIMNRTVEAVAIFAERYNGWHPRFLDSLLKRVAMLSIVHYAYSEEFTLEEFSRNDLTASLFRRKQEEPIDPRIENIRKISHALNYIHTKWEDPIRDFLTKGFLDGTAEPIFKEAEQRHAFDELNEKHVEIWQLYHHSFAPSQDEFVRAQVEFLKAHCEDLRVQDVYAAIEVVQQLVGETDELKGILRRAIDAAPKSFDPQDPRDRYSDRLPEAIRNEIIAKVREAKPRESLPILAESLGGNSGYTSAKFADLSTYSTQDFVDWLKADRSRDTINLVNEILQRAHSTTGYNTPVVIERLKAALWELRSRSKIDEMRVDIFALKGLRVLEERDKVSVEDTATPDSLSSVPSPQSPQDASGAASAPT